MIFLFLFFYRSKPCLAVVPWKSPDDRLALSTGRKQVHEVMGFHAWLIVSNKVRRSLKYHYSENMVSTLNELTSHCTARFALWWWWWWWCCWCWWWWWWCCCWWWWWWWYMYSACTIYNTHPNIVSWHSLYPKWIVLFAGGLAYLEVICKVLFTSELSKLLLCTKVMLKNSRILLFSWFC